MGYLEKYRIFAPELRRSLHIAKYRNEQKSARFHIVTYIIKANAQLLDFQSKSKLERVTSFNYWYNCGNIIKELCSFFIYKNIILYSIKKNKVSTNYFRFINKLI